MRISVRISVWGCSLKAASVFSGTQTDIVKKCDLGKRPLRKWSAGKLLILEKVEPWQKWLLGKVEPWKTFNLGNGGASEKWNHEKCLNF